LPPYATGWQPGPWPLGKARDALGRFVIECLYRRNGLPPLTFEEQLLETRQRVAAMDVRCSSVGRDPASLRRSYFMLDMTRRLRGGAILYYESEEIFTKMALQLIALGISELVVMYPWVDHQIPMLERIARNTLPALKAAHIA
jgi:hypothetical protein